MSAECSTETIPPGYKQTEVGVIPKDWDVKILGSLITSLEAGVSVNSVETEKDTYAHNASILKTSCVIGGKFIPEEHKTIVPHEISRAKLNPRKDSIIISRMNTKELVGECGYVDQDYTNLFLPDRLWLTRHDSRLPHCVRWLAYLLSSNSFNNAIKDSATGTSGSMKNISKESILSVYIPFPPKAEQESIAEALSDTDALIESLEQLIAKKRQIKQGAMQELLTGKKRLPGFEIKSGYKQMEAGVIPEDWEVSSLRNCCCKITDGTHDTPKPVRLGIPFLTAIHVKDNWIDFDSCLYVTEADHKIIFSRCNPEKNDVLMVNIGMGVATTALVNVAYEFSLKNVALLKPESQRTIGSYLNYSIAQVKQRITQDLSSGGAQPFLSLTQIGEITIPLPPTKAEQEAIAAILSDMDSEITSLEEKLAKAHQIKQGMMQELLTGRVRLI